MIRREWGVCVRNASQAERRACDRRSMCDNMERNRREKQMTWQKQKAKASGIEFKESSIKKHCFVSPQIQEFKCIRQKSLDTIGSESTQLKYLVDFYLNSELKWRILCKNICIKHMYIYSHQNNNMWDQRLRREWKRTIAICCFHATITYKWQEHLQSKTGCPLVQKLPLSPTLTFINWRVQMW